MFNFVFPLASLFLKQGVIWRLGVNNIYQMGACGSALMAVVLLVVVCGARVCVCHI